MNKNYSNLIYLQLTKKILQGKIKKVKIHIL